jgi:hypothetical protein
LAVGRTEVFALAFRARGEDVSDEPRHWTLSRFEDGALCRAIGPRESSSCAERVNVMEIAPLAAVTLPGFDPDFQNYDELGYEIDIAERAYREAECRRAVTTQGDSDE